jgi:hypothetical protein
LNEAAKLYVERNWKKWELAGRPLWMVKLPRDFTCWHYRKDVPIEEAHHRGLIVALARPRGALEYVMLEAERALFRRIPSERSQRRKIRGEIMKKMELATP